MLCDSVRTLTVARGTKVSIPGMKLYTAAPSVAYAKKDGRASPR